MVLEENTICYISESGHNNFLYPSQQKVLVKERCEVKKLSLISGGSKIAIKILCLWNRVISTCCLGVIVGRNRVMDAGAFELELDYGEDKLVNQLVEQNLIPRRFLNVLKHV